VIPYPSEPRVSNLVNPGSLIPEIEGAAAALPAADAPLHKRRAAPATVKRETFSTSRRLEFLSLSELEKQSGYDRDRWPEVIVKELVDNALDACEESGVPPEVSIEITDRCIVVTDNGPGMPPETVHGIVDLDRRVSSRESYMAPDRGAQGNATKVLLGMPFALRPDAPGSLEIEAHGLRHVLAVGVDGLSDVPAVTLDTQPGVVKTGTRVSVHLPCSLTDDESPFFQVDGSPRAVYRRVLRMHMAFAALNPHLSLSLTWNGDPFGPEVPSNPDWPKWRPGNPTSVHWYDAAKFAALVKRCIASDRDRGVDRPVRQFVAMFDGMSSTGVQRDVLAECSMARTGLSALAPDGEPDAKLIAALHDAMRQRAKVVAAKRLGCIGREHLQSVAVGFGADPETFRYVRVLHDDDASPAVTEIGFAAPVDDDTRLLLCGVNWSAAIRNPFRLRGTGSWDSSLDAVLQQRYAGDDEPVVMIVHHAQVGATYTDRGKGTLSLSQSVSSRIREAVEKATLPWWKQRKAEERESRAILRRSEAMKQHKPRTVSIKQAAHEIMPAVYAELSSDGQGGTLPVNARQFMYRARPLILERTGKTEMGDAYFTQRLLPDFISDNPDVAGEWDVVYDDRGHFTEPHTRHVVNLGTIDVRKYLARCGPLPSVMPTLGVTKVALHPTHGPCNRFAAVLFIEKEGFMPLLSRVRLAERYDLAIMSTKGLSNVAARRLVDEVCGEAGVPLFVLHDFDKAGFSILGTLRNSTRRYQYRNAVEVIDLGVRLEDVQRWNLQAEPVMYGRGGNGNRANANPRDNLRENGATDDELAFLVSDPEITSRNGKPRHVYRGQRVELNAFAPRDFVAWIEGKLQAHGVAKVIPDDDALAAQYRCGVAHAELSRRILELESRFVVDAAECVVPATLRESVQTILQADPALSWDHAVLRVARNAGKQDDTR
jgi:hypothetical protein